MKAKILLLGFICSFILGCEKNEVKEEENELITTVRLKFLEGSNTQAFAWKDIDGYGGVSPTKETISLKPNTTYTVEVAFLDESKSPATDITTEVKAEADEHLVVYTPSPASLLTYTYSDKDSRNLPIGLIGTIKTNSTGTGMLKIQLRHQPPSGNTPTKNGSATVGSDDVNIDFDVSVK